MNREATIAQYWKLEDQLKRLARKVGLSASQLTKELVSQPEELIFQVRPILQRQVELLHQMRTWELEPKSNITLLPVSSLRHTHNKQKASYNGTFCIL